MRFDLVDLRLFLHVGDAASITHGAARANLSLPAASERIRAMEEVLGVTLLERGRRGVGLTPAGRSLAHHARLVLQQVERMRGELSAYAQGLKGFVRLLANTSAMTEFLPEVLSEFLAAHPNIDVDLEERPSFDIVRSVAEGIADAGIVADIVDFGALEAFPFATDRLVAVMAREHPLASCRSLRFRELLDDPFVGLGGASALQHHLAQHATQAGRPLKLRVRLSNFEAICRMVERGVGVAVIPETAARRSRKLTAIRLVRLADPWSLRQLTLCVRRLNELPMPAQLLVAHLRRQPSEAASG
ncbi:MAG: LysR family transcriptional regulator [Rhodospirillales bacterium]|nr:LysR family transcriptional regulator [Rhodospirillales bacterium]